MDLNNFTKSLVEQIATDLTVAFDDNFAKEEFFGNKWDKRKDNKAHKILSKRGFSGLRGSINHRIVGNRISWTSSLPYASIHNEGLRVKGVRKIRKYTNKNFMGKGKPVKIKAHIRNVNFKMPQRQFIGLNNPEVHKRITEVVDHNMAKLNQNILKMLKK